MTLTEVPEQSIDYKTERKVVSKSGTIHYTGPRSLHFHFHCMSGTNRIRTYCGYHIRPDEADLRPGIMDCRWCAEKKAFFENNPARPTGPSDNKAA